jgi:hypothetical protein
MDRFGELLRFYRLQSVDMELGKKLTQERLGQLLGDELGDAGYSGAAISDWERNKSQIHKDHRAVLLSLIKVLFGCGGLKTRQEANAMLLAGNYRPLDEKERNSIFGNQPEIPQAPFQLNGNWRMLKVFFDDAILRSKDEIQKLISESKSNPPNHWTQTLLTLLGWPFKQWTSEQVAKTVVWITIWFLTWRLTFPLIHWPFDNPIRAFQATIAYICGAIIIPLFIGGLTRTAGDRFWQQQDLANAGVLRLYTHQGAFLGFAIGYFSIFVLALLCHYLLLGSLSITIWMFASIWPVLLGYAAARQVPFNLWRAYGALRLKDGWIFFFAIFSGPLWGCFFFNYYPMLLSDTVGPMLLLFSIGILSGWVAWKQRRGEAKETPIFKKTDD